MISTRRQWYVLPVNRLSPHRSPITKQHLTHMTFPKTRFLIAAAAVAALASPTFTFAATYAYVNTSGDVTTVTASDANTAIMTAPNIAPRSGVLLLDSESDNEVIGDDVAGV